MLVVTEHDGADRVLLEVERQAEGVSGELEHLAVTRIGETVNARMPSVTDTIVPTLRASVTPLKLSIRCLIRSLISVALIAI